MPLPESMKAPLGFRFEEPEGRPFRITSIETEVDGPRGPDSIAKNLYSCGIVNAPYRQDYKYDPGWNHPHIGFFAFDGTVTGGELVFDRVDLTLDRHAEAMVEAHEALYVLEQEGKVQYNPNCGGHAHIDATQYGFYDLVRFMILFGHLEEPIFRLAGAGKTYGHRTLYRGLDRPAPGRVYTNPIMKGPFGTVDDTVAKLAHHPRHSGINTQFYTNQNRCTGRCKTATVLFEKKPRDPEAPTHKVYDQKTCSCKKNKLTLEWRVWNAQGNPRILYAWIALMQAMHAYAWRPTGHSYDKYEHMEPYTWTWQPFSKLTREGKKMIQDRVEWMFTELPLTPVEKDALRYAYMKTPYKVFGKDWFIRLADTAYRKPPYPNTYKKLVQRQVKYGCKEGLPVNPNQPAPPEPDAGYQEALHELPELPIEDLPPDFWDDEQEAMPAPPFNRPDEVHNPQQRVPPWEPGGRRRNDVRLRQGGPLYFAWLRMMNEMHEEHRR